MHFLPANRLRLYRNFKALEANDFYGTIRFYERFENALRALDFEEYLECTVLYANALFETEQYGKHVVMCDHLLEIVIENNVHSWGGDDIFLKILYDKAVSLFYLRDFSTSAHVLRELIKMDPLHNGYLRLLNKNLLYQRPHWMRTTRALFILLVLLSAVTIVLQLFLIKPFMSDLEAQTQMLHYAMLGSGIGILLFAESLHAWRCMRRSTGFRDEILKRTS